MKIKVLLVMPGKEPQVVRIPASMKYIKSFIGEDLFRIELDKNNILIADKNANLADFNRILGGNIISGAFFVISRKRDRRVSMKKKDIRKYTNMFSLRKHQKKINIYREEYLEEYYSNQRKMKQKNAKRNKEQIFKIAA